MTPQQVNDRLEKVAGRTTAEIRAWRRHVYISENSGGDRLFSPPPAKSAEMRDTLIKPAELDEVIRALRDILCARPPSSYPAGRPDQARLWFQATFIAKHRFFYLGATPEKVASWLRTEEGLLFMEHLEAARDLMLEAERMLYVRV